MIKVLKDDLEFKKNMLHQYIQRTTYQQTMLTFVNKLNSTHSIKNIIKVKNHIYTPNKEENAGE